MLALGANRSRRAAMLLVWSRKPCRYRHATLGVRKVWRTSCRRYEVHQFSEGIGDFASVFRSEESRRDGFVPAPFAHKRTLAAAKRAAEQHARNMLPT